MPEIAWFVSIIALLLVLGYQAVQVNVRSEVRHVFAEVVVSVNLKHLNLHLLDVFDVHEQPNSLINTKCCFVVVCELNVCRMLELIDNLLGLWVIFHFKVV